MPDNDIDLPNGAGRPVPCGSVVQADSSISINNMAHRPNKLVLKIIRTALDLIYLIIPRDVSPFSYNIAIA